MVTSTKAAQEAEAGAAEAAPPRTLLGQVNAHLTCALCGGYYVDATTIVECLHSFCRSCIVKHLQARKYCPVCEMMINAAKPNIKPDKALQDIVYKLVPGLFQREMERRRRFYSSRPASAASATPEQRGEDTERIIFSPEDVISFSLEYAEAGDAESVSSRSSESGGEAPGGNTPTTRRYLQCPAVVNVGHLKKFLSVKFDIDCGKFCIDILYKQVELPDYYTLMDIAYIFTWKRNEPMRFFYQITDYSAIRSRFDLFDIGRKNSRFRDRKPSPTSTEDMNANSPAPPSNDPSSEGTSGTNSPMPDDSNNFVSSKATQEKCIKKYEKSLFQSKSNVGTEDNSSSGSSGVKPSESPTRPTPELDEEKSQFLNSFELTAKSSIMSGQSVSPVKPNEPGTARAPDKTNKTPEKTDMTPDKTDKTPVKSPKGASGSPHKSEDGLLKRKVNSTSETVETKKQKYDKEVNLPKNTPGPPASQSSVTPQPAQNSRFTSALKVEETQKKASNTNSSAAVPSHPVQSPKPVQQMRKPTEHIHPDQSKISAPQSIPSEQTLKRTLQSSQIQTPSSPKRTPSNEPTVISQSQSTSSSLANKNLPPPNIDGSKAPSKNNEAPKTNPKKLPELKLTIPNPGVVNKNKPQPPMHRGIRTDLLANNSDPTIDRRKILAQHVKSPLSAPNPGQISGDPLKSLFDSCKINIPSSLSITLTDQKLDPRNLGESGCGSDQKLFNKSSLNGSNTFNHMKTPTPPVQNSIEILKLPDLDPMKPVRPETMAPPKTSQPNKSDTPSAKGPMPSLKPISDTKLGKPPNFVKPTTFQQTFLQSLQQADKPKLQKNKSQVPKLMPTNSNVKPLTSDSNDAISANQSAGIPTSENKGIAACKSDSVLDLSTPHTTQSQLGPQQTKALETMQTIANLAKKQSLPPKPNISQCAPSFPHSANKSVTSVQSPLRMPTQNNQNKLNNPALTSNAAGSRQELLQSSKPGLFRPSGNPSPNTSSLGNQLSQQSSSPSQPSPRSHTRSPSSSPKLVIAEEKQTTSGGTDSNANQSNQISSSQISSSIMAKRDAPAPRPSPGPSKPLNPKLAKAPPVAKLINARFPGSSGKPGSSTPSTPGVDMLPLLAQQQAYMRQQYEIQSQIGHILPTPAQWLNKINQARHIENFMKSLSNAQQAQNDFSGKDNSK